MGHKLDVIKTEYWAKGINTDQIPWPILREYAIQDADLTYRLYLKQQEVLTPIQERLHSVQCQDLLVLQQMEWNGIMYDEETCVSEEKRIDDKISEIKTSLNNVYPGVPINFSSGDHLSAFLYGGVVKEDAKEHVGFFKSGKQAGMPKYKNIVIEHELPQLFKPLRGSELVKEGFYGTAEPLLKQLRGSAKVRRYVDMLLELSKLEKLNGTYYRGLPKLNGAMNWPEATLHSTLNQCVTATGRLSSSKPNSQNLATDLLNIFVTRY